MTTVAENLQQISRQMRDFEQRYGRSANSVRLLAVSKQQSIEKIHEAAQAGVRDFGENYLQEAESKIAALASLGLCWHFIGPIQSNKTRMIAELFDWVHSIERDKIARRLSEQRPAGMPPLNVCVQVNLSGEKSKSGCTLQDVDALCDEIALLSGLKLRGLMAIPAPLDQLDEQRAAFAPLADRFQRLKRLHPGMDTLSIGMSNDFEAAIAEGSTQIRLGTAIFGARRA